MPSIQQPVKLAAEYERLCATPSDIYRHLPKFVAACLDLDAKHIIELGTRAGVSTVAWLHGLEITGGHLWSVDLDPRPNIGTYCHWSFLQGDDCDPDVFSLLPTADVVFIDTSHDYTHTLRELNLYRWLVRPGGQIMLHDTELAYPIDIPAQPAFPVRRAINEFCAAEGLTWENDPDCFGLGTVYV